VDTSAVLRATLERGTTPEIEERIAAAPALVTSRLSLVESARAFHRLRQRGGIAETRLADARRETDILWNRCDLWELSPAVCELAMHIAPHRPLRTLDALQLATFLLARRRLEALELLTADARLDEAATSI
jgi:predicted nucleic acid-binding protein